MLPGMTVRELSVTVDSSDDSYMPRTIVVLVGNVEKQLQEIKTVHVPRDKTGPVVLVKNLGGVYHFVQINIRACHSDGCDVKIRGLHVKGSKYVCVSGFDHSVYQLASIRPCVHAGCRNRNSPLFWTPLQCGTSVYWPPQPKQPFLLLLI